MIEIQQLIVRAKVNSGESEVQNITEIVESIVENHLKSATALKESEKKTLIEECSNVILEKIEFRFRK